MVACRSVAAPYTMCLSIVCYASGLQNKNVLVDYYQYCYYFIISFFIVIV